jgi:hypothetical protein
LTAEARPFSAFAGMTGVVVALAVAACAPQRAMLPQSPLPAGPAIRVAAEPVAEGPPGYDNRVATCAPTCPGGFAYAGGLALTSNDTSRFHGLSDLHVEADGRMVAVTDEGDLVKGRIVLDGAGRPTGLAAVTLAPLTDPGGRPLSGDKADSDAEGLAIRANGDMLVGFERRHRVWLYPAGGGSPHPIPLPDTAFPENEGPEALAMDPQAGPDAYLVGREDTRETWICRLGRGCTPGVRPGQDDQGKLVAARSLPGGRWAFLLRDFNLIAGARIRLLITDRAGRTLDGLLIARPATVDNFEGLAAVPRADGSVRFYLVSDDNFASNQRTLLMAFDWRPPKRR